MPSGSDLEAARFQRELSATQRLDAAASDEGGRLRIWMRFYSRWLICRYRRLPRCMRLVGTFAGRRYEPSILLVTDEPDQTRNDHRQISVRLEDAVCGMVYCGDRQSIQERAALATAAVQKGVARAIAIASLQRQSAGVEAID